MLLVDNILLFPLTGFLSVLRKIHAAAEQEYANEGDTVRTQLTDLYMMLETGRITTEEFTSKESELLDRLDAIMSRKSATSNEEETEQT